MKNILGLTVMAIVLTFQLASAAGQMTLKVEGMTCGGCEESIEAEIKKIPGVKSCEADHKAGTVKIETDSKTKVTAAQLTKAVAKAGDYKVK